MSAHDAIVDLFMQAGVGAAISARLARLWARSASHSRHRFEELFERYDEPLRTGMRRSLALPKLANMTRAGAASRILAAASIDLDPPQDLILELGWIMQLGNAHMLLVDEVIDNKHQHDPSRQDLIPVGEIFWLEFLLGMQRICGPGAGLNERLRRDYHHAFNAICWEETRHVGSISSYLEEDFAQIERKCAPLKLVFYPLLKQQGRLQLEPRIGRCIDCFVLSCLVLDDYKDWREDLLNRRFTWPLTLGLARCGIEGVEDLPQPDDAFICRLHTAMVASEVCLHVYKRSLAALEQAQEAAEGVLPTVARLMEHRLEEMRSGLKTMIAAQRESLRQVA